MKQVGKILSMFLIHGMIIRPAIYISTWLRGRNPHKYEIDVEITYTPKAEIVYTPKAKQ